ncbi:unnamed protein product [Citrullus colocynthis]|uniref:Uncharacterized protein n=1 Tax=Citrullus colocynthis TaxID=252529 RepID=A0ABP0YCM1_9ROSI
MEEFDSAIVDVDLAKMGVLGNWFTWTSKIHGLGILHRLDRVLAEADDLLETVASVWTWHQGVSPLVCLVWNLQALKPILKGRFGCHISQLSEGVKAAKVDMDRA